MDRQDAEGLHEERQSKRRSDGTEDNLRRTWVVESILLQPFQWLAGLKASEPSESGKIVLWNHNLWSCGIFFVEFDGESRGQNSNRNTVKKTAENGHKSRAMKMRPVLRHWCQASSIWGCGMILSSTGCIRYTTAGAYSNWFRLIMNITICSCDLATHGDVVPLASCKRSHVPILSLSVWPSSRLVLCNSDAGSPGSTGKTSIRLEPMILDCSFPLTWWWQIIYEKVKVNSSRSLTLTSVEKRQRLPFYIYPLFSLKGWAWDWEKVHFNTSSSWCWFTLTFATVESAQKSVLSV